MENSMGKVNKLLVACDLSTYSVQALEYGADIAESVGAEVVIINVINQRDLDMIEKLKKYSDKLSVKEFVRETIEYRSKEIKKILEKSKRDPDAYRIVFRTGVPFREIIDTIRKEKADILAMGTKGRTALGEVLFGTTAQKMFRRCPIPLLSVRVDVSI